MKKIDPGLLALTLEDRGRIATRLRLEKPAAATTAGAAKGSAG